MRENGRNPGGLPGAWLGCPPAGGSHLLSRRMEGGSRRVGGTYKDNVVTKESSGHPGGVVPHTVRVELRGG